MSRKPLIDDHRTIGLQQHWVWVLQIGALAWGLLLGVAARVLPGVIGVPAPALLLFFPLSLLAGVVAHTVLAYRQERKHRRPVAAMIPILLCVVAIRMLLFAILCLLGALAGMLFFNLFYRLF